MFFPDHTPWTIGIIQSTNQPIDQSINQSINQSLGWFALTIGRLSEDEIERMLKEAEENAEADKKERQKVEAKNQLEGYLYSLRNTLDDDGMCCMS